MTPDQEQYIEKQTNAFIEKLERQLNNVPKATWTETLGIVMSLVEIAHQAAKEDE